MDPNTTYQEISKLHEQTARQFIIKVYAWMTLALIITGVSGLSVASSPLLLSLIFNSQITFFGLIIAEVVLVIYLSTRIFSMSSGMAKLWFILYAVLNGATLASIFLTYNIATIGYAFLVTATLFGVMSLYGYFTKTDLTAIGNLFIMGLFGVIIATVFNMFYRSDALSLMLTYVGVFIFIGLIGYDTQKIKGLSYMNRGTRENSGNASIIGALTLYLDFINLFIRLIRLIGRK
ncbi:MAG: Bax inhibitor/YccA family protein [Clostridia bacterium]|jgi:FtsH-binding integral membrane protein|nr:Bax inhibitor/YccA family protein [Clostridia bacterium]